jgi:hypothetical protein
MLRLPLPLLLGGQNENLRIVTFFNFRNKP